MESNEPLAQCVPSNGENDRVKKGLHCAIRFAEGMLGQQGTAIRIPLQWSAPPVLEGRSCVYILELSDANELRYYVGETDSLHHCLGQHRSKGGA